MLMCTAAAQNTMLIEDVEFTYDQIKKYHPKFKNKNDSLRIAQTKEEVIQKVNQQPDIDPAVAIGSVLRSLRDGHTGLKNTRPSYFLPFTLQYSNGSFYIDKSWNSSFMKGDIISSYNSKPLDTFYLNTKMYICSVDDNYDYLLDSRKTIFLNNCNRLGLSSTEQVQVSILRNNKELTVRTIFYFLTQLHL